MTDKTGLWRPLGRVLLFLIGCAVALAFTASLPLARPGPALELFIGSVGSVWAFALTVLFVRWDGLRLSDVGARPGRKSLSRFAVGFLIGLLLVALHSLLVGAIGHIRWERTAGVRADQAALLLAGYVCLSAREELAFHGYPLRRLQAPLGVWGAQGIVALAFALEHMAGGWSFAKAVYGAAVGSLLFGMASLATRGLAVPIGLHAAWNFADWMRGNRGTPGVWRPEVAPGFEQRVDSAGSFSYVAVMALATIAFWYWYRSQEAAKGREN